MRELAALVQEIVPQARIEVTSAGERDVAGLVSRVSGDALAELEHGLLITEEVLRHLVTRDERPVKVSRREDGGDVDETDDTDLPSGIDEEEDEDDGRERIGEDESEAAPAAID